MGLLAVILALEVWPMITLIGWRRGLGKQEDGWVPDERIAQRIAKISYVEAALVLAMVMAAVTMAFT